MLNAPGDALSIRKAAVYRRRSAEVGGFSLIEVVVALVLLSLIILGMGASAGTLSRYAATTEVRTLAAQAVQDKISVVKVDPRYGALDSLHAGVETELEGLPGFTRTTEVAWVRETGAGGGVLDYRIVSVVVAGPGLERALSRRIVVAAP